MVLTASAKRWRVLSGPVPTPHTQRPGRTGAYALVGRTLANEVDCERNRAFRIFFAPKKVTNHAIACSNGKTKLISNGFLKVTTIHIPWEFVRRSLFGVLSYEEPIPDSSRIEKGTSKRSRNSYSTDS